MRNPKITAKELFSDTELGRARFKVAEAQIKEVVREIQKETRQFFADQKREEQWRSECDGRAASGRKQKLNP